MFIALEVSFEAIKSLRVLVPHIERHDRDLADQIKRAASSERPSQRSQRAASARRAIPPSPTRDSRIFEPTWVAVAVGSRCRRSMCPN
jgi:hypothetical protein